MRPDGLWRRRFRPDDRGSAAVEMAMLAWVFFAFVGLTVMVGKLNEVSAHVESVARSAARDISLARDTSEGVAEARDRIEDQLSGEGMCDGLTIDVNPTPITDDTTEVTVTIDCNVDLGDAAFAEIITDQVDFTRSATEALDEYREREA